MKNLRNFFIKATDFVGSMLTVPLISQYWKGSGNYKRIEDNNYRLRLGPFGMKWGYLKPLTTGFLPKGLTRVAKDESGGEINIPAELQTIDGKFDIMLNGFNQNVSYQIEYTVVNPEKYYWELKADKNKINDMVISKLISNLQHSGLPKHVVDEETEITNENRFSDLFNDSSRKLAYGNGFKNDDASIELFKEYGVKVKHVRLTSRDPDRSALASMMKLQDAINTSKADKIRLQQTYGNTQGYLEAGKLYAEAGDAGKIGLRLQEMDNDETISKNTPMILTKLLGGQDNSRKTSDLESRVGNIENGLQSMAQGIQGVTDNLAEKISQLSSFIRPNSPEVNPA